MLNNSYLSTYAKSFNWAGFFLPKKIYLKCSNLYDFCRTVDNIADDLGEIDPESHVVVITLGELKNSGSRDGIQTEGDVLVIRDDCGIVLRCPECRRVLREGVCTEHDVVEGVEDLRLRFVIDDGLASANVVVGRAASEKFLQQDMASIQSRINEEGSANFVKEIKEKLFGNRISINGRAIVDDRGIMLLPDSVVEKLDDPVAIAANVRETWGVVL